ncbi:hypothetical protein EB796_015063 [Bugula neritina]|uniref:Uncharacterized protein n=1 Tax=Bugula neritina TaxID=10212 RepID=A0A7J7JMH4_BUGNE|nr:hypothetical protein EB796_015063 [Bugula neritina]
MANMKLLTFLLATMLVAHYIQEHDHSDETVTISLHDLEHVYEELFKKIHCDEKETVANCTVCLESLVGVSEEIHTLKEWNEASVRALYALLDIGPSATCLPVN